MSTYPQKLPGVVTAPLAWAESPGTVTSELASTEPQAQSARCSVAVCSALRWAVFPCGWKWEIGKMTREGETPVALFEHQHHAESFCRQWWPQLGEVRSWPNIADQRRSPE